MSRSSAIAKLLAGAAALPLFACQPRPAVQPQPPVATAPKPEPPPQDPAAVVDGDVTVAYENGLRILVKRTPGAELVAMNLYLLGGAVERSKALEGSELLALRAAVRGGAGDNDKQAFFKRLNALGSSISASVGQTYSKIAAKTLRENFAPTFAMLSDTLLRPRMPKSELDVLRRQQLAGIANRSVTPDGRLRTLVKSQLYKDHPLGLYSDGNKKVVSSLGVEDLTKVLEKFRFSSRLVLVVVGDISATDVRKAVRQRLGTLPRGKFVAKKLKAPRFESAQLKLVEIMAPTNYVSANFMGPRWGDPGFMAGIVGMKILSRRVFEEVRTKRNLSYAPAAPYAWTSDFSRGGLYVTAVDVNTTMKVMLHEAKLLGEKLVSSKELAGAKAGFLTDQLMAQESTNGQAAWLGMCDRTAGDWRLIRSLPDSVNKVTAEEIRDFAKRYFKNLQTVVLGPAKDVDRTLLESL
jgi:zinc protease